MMNIENYKINYKILCDYWDSNEDCPALENDLLFAVERIYSTCSKEEKNAIDEWIITQD